MIALTLFVQTALYVSGLVACRTGVRFVFVEPKSSYGWSFMVGGMVVTLFAMAWFVLTFGMRS